MQESVTGLSVNFFNCVSLGIFIIGFLLFLLPGVRNWSRHRPDPGVQARFHVLVLMTFAAVLFFELSKTEDEGSTTVIRMLQAFTTDADYDFMALPILFGGGKPCGWMMVYRGVLYTAAPFLGAALIYEVFAGLSPKLRLFRSALFGTLYVFSELNACSLALAEDIVRRKPTGSTILVFTDCYVSHEDEGSSELLMHARALHAICLREDIQHLPRLATARRCRFFLLDTDETGALDDESNLIGVQYLLTSKEGQKAGKRKRGYLRELYFFSDNSTTINSLCVLDNDLRYTNPDLMPVRVVRNTALACCALLQDEPLFKALPSNKKGAPMRVAIFGDNAFAREMLKTVFWCGQMLDHPLQICMVGSAGKEAFFRWLDGVSPELAESCRKGSPLLYAQADGDPQPPYASLDYISEDTADLRSLLAKEHAFPNGSEDAYRLEDFDCFFVMGEGDHANIRLAEELVRCLWLRNRGRDEKRGPQMVAALVEREELKALTEKQLAGQKAEDDQPRFFCFGALSERFTWENISRESRIIPLHTVQKEKKKKVVDIYGKWSTYARTFHLPYKIFSFCGATGSGPEARIRYWDAISCELENGKLGEVSRLIWLEHRRWNAFLRCLGFTQPPRLDDHLGETDVEIPWIAEKDLRTRTHPNLVEASADEKDGRPKDLLDQSGDLRAWPSEAPKESAHPYAALIPASVKKYDIPFDEYAPRLSEEELRELLDAPDWEKLEGCRDGSPAAEGKMYYLDLIQINAPEIYEALRKKAEQEPKEAPEAAGENT